MNTARFDLALKSALKDPDEETWSAEERQLAMNRAIREYSRYSPLKRRMGTGSLTAAVDAGDTSMVVTGGPYRVGDVITIDQFGSSETKTITSVAATSTATEGVGEYTTIGFTALTYAHPIGAFIQKSTLGISLVAGTDTYLLPYDFLSFEQNSFGLAVGARSAIKKYQTFYDALNVFSGLLSGIGYGMSQGFRGGNSVPMMAVPDAPSAFNAPAGGISETQYVIVDGPPSLLIVLPAPTVASNLDFFYFGLHSPETIPDSEMELLLLYAVYSAISAATTSFAAEGDIKDGDVELGNAASSKAMLELARHSLEQWNRRLRFRPLMVSG